MNISEVEKIVEEVYQIKGSAKPLVAYEDLNYQIHTKVRRYVLKFHSKDFEVIKAQNRILRQLQDKSVKIPHPIKSCKGNDEELILHNGNELLIRLLSFMEGETSDPSSWGKKTLYSLGVELARLDGELMKLSSPVIERRKIDWDVANLMMNRKYLGAIENPSRRRLVQYYMMAFEQEVVPKIDKLRHSLIQNDANEHNILIRDGEVSGIIDFGDMVYAPLINEVAVALTYAMMARDELWEKPLMLLKGYHDTLPLKPNEVTLLYYLVAARLCISVCHSAFHMKSDSGSTYHLVSDENAWNMLEKWVGLSPRKVTNLFLKACSMSELKNNEMSQIAENRKHYFSTALSISYHNPILMERAAFQYMFDENGKTYLDCVNNIMHVGHCHPEVVEAGRLQMSRLNTNTRYHYRLLTDYAEKLLEKFPKHLNKVFFVNSGSAATDLALRLTRTHTQQNRMLVLEHGYHGNTQAAIEVSSYKFDGTGGYGHGGDVLKVPLPKDVIQADQVINSLEEKIAGQPVGGVIAESIVGCGGQVVLPEQFLKELFQLVKNKGGVCIADEVQTGFGRIGTHFWAYEKEGVIPDIVILGKPMGNGHPMAAVVTTSQITSSFENGMEFFSSFGGNPVSCAIGLAVLKVIEEESLQQHALEVGNNLLDQLIQLQSSRPLISDIRGSGLFLGIEINGESPSTSRQLAEKLINQAREEGVLLSTDGPNNNVIKIKPPLCFDRKNADTLISTMSNILNGI